jgi:hypothetical protein
MSSTKSAPQNIGQADLFGLSVETPGGFRYQPDFITVDEEARLLHELESLPFQPFDFHGHLANRRVIGFGLRYDYDRRRLVNAPPVPGFFYRSGRRSRHLRRSRLNHSRKCSSTSTGRAQGSGGTGTNRISPMLPASRFLQRVTSGFAGKQRKAGIGRRSWSREDQPIFSPAL